MSKASRLNISDIEYKIAGYRSFFDSTKEVNEQILSQNDLTDSQSLFLEILREFDCFTQSNRNPAQNREVNLKVENYIESLDEIEREIRREQEKRLTLNSSSRLSDLFHNENSFNNPMQPEGRSKVASGISSIDLMDRNILHSSQVVNNKVDSYSNDEQVKVDITPHQRSSHLKSNASVLFAILSNISSKQDCPYFLGKKKASQINGHEFFEINIKNSILQERQRSIRVMFKNKDFFILSQSHDGVFREIKDLEMSDKILSKILKAIYLSSNVKSLVLDTQLYKIVNGFYIDQAGKLVAYDNDTKSLAVKSPHAVSGYDYRIIEDRDVVDLDSIYKLLININYVKSTKSFKRDDGTILITPKSQDKSRDKYGMVNNHGLMQIYQKLPDDSFVIANNSRQVIEFAKKLESDIKDTLIFDSFSGALRGKWHLLNKISTDSRITKDSIIDHVQLYLSSPKDHPFDINFLAKAAIAVQSLNSHISRLIVVNRSHFLPQIIFGFLDPSPESSSFVIRTFAQHSNFLDIDESNNNDQNYSVNIKESLGLITHTLINSRGLDFAKDGFVTDSDFCSAYTNCLSKYSKQLLSSRQEDIPSLSAAIYRSFSKLIEASTPPYSPDSSKHLILPLITRILSTFSHQPSLGLLIHRIMIDALSDSRIDRKSKGFTAIILKICASMVKSQEISKDRIKAFDRLIIASHHDSNLVNLIKISLNQIVSGHDSADSRADSFNKFTINQRLRTLSLLDCNPDNIAHYPNHDAAQVLRSTSSYLSHDELFCLIRNARREINLLPCDLSVTNKAKRIAKAIDNIESRYNLFNPNYINFNQSYLDFDRMITKTIITDHHDNVLYRVGDSIFDFIAAPIRHFFSQDPMMCEFLLKEAQSVNVSAQDHGINLDSKEDIYAIKRLASRLKVAIHDIVGHVYNKDPNHPYLTFMKGFNNTILTDIAAKTQSYLEDLYPSQFICNTSDETVTVRLMPKSVQYIANCHIDITKQDFVPNKILASLQARRLVSVNYLNNAKIISNNSVHSLKSYNLDLKVLDALQNYIASNADTQQFDDVFYDLITNPVMANGLASLFMDENSGFHRFNLSANEEQVYVPLNQDSGFIFTINRNSNRTIASVILHESLYTLNTKDNSLDIIAQHLTPQNLKDLMLRLDNVARLCHNINNNSRPLKDAFCELKATKFNKKSQIGDIRSTDRYKFKFRAIGKFKSGKKLYLDANGRIMVNTSLAKIKLAPISHPQPHLVTKLPVQEVSSDFNLTFRAQHFDHRKKSLQKTLSTFQVAVRKVGVFQDSKGNVVDIYQDRSGVRYKSILNSANLQEIFDFNISKESCEVQDIIDSFKQRALVHEIFNAKNPQPLTCDNSEVVIGRIENLSSTTRSAKTTHIRQVAANLAANNDKKPFHIDQFGVIYTKNKQNKIQKYDLTDLDQISKQAIVKALNLSVDNARLAKIYNLLEKNSNYDKVYVNLKPFNGNRAYVFVKNGIKYALFQDQITSDHHLMRLSHPKGVKDCGNIVISDPNLIKLITSQIEKQALYHNLQSATYLIHGANHLTIHQEKYRNLTIKFFKLSDVDENITVNSSQDQIIAIDSDYRILHKKINSNDYHIATFQEAKKLTSYIYQAITRSVVKLDDWKHHYTALLSKKVTFSSKKATKLPAIANNIIPDITVDNLHIYDKSD